MKRSWKSLAVGIAVVVAAAALYYAHPPAAAPQPVLRDGCRPPDNYRFAPRPRFDAATPLVGHIEAVTIDRPLAQVVAMVERAALEDSIAASDLPHVTGTHDLSARPFGAPGTRRMTCLSDGSFLVEEVLRNTKSPGRDEFAYLVWNYTSPQAAPIAYSIGRFVRTAAAPGATRTEWSYRFRLRDDRFPGDLGPLGRFAFRKAFLERSYAAMMRATLADEKRRAERLPHPLPPSPSG
jgi:hypothetical protein